MANMSDIVRDLDDLKGQIAEAKQEKAEKMGQLAEKSKQLKAFGVKSVDEAKLKLKIMEKEIKEMEQEIVDGFESLKKQYEW